MTITTATHTQAMACLNCGLAGETPPDHFPQKAGHWDDPCPNCGERMVWVTEPIEREVAEQDYGAIADDVLTVRYEAIWRNRETGEERTVIPSYEPACGILSEQGPLWKLAYRVEEESR